MEVDPVQAKGEGLSEGMMSVKAAASFCSLSRAELYAALARGELRSFKYRRRRLLAKRDVVAWLEANLVPSG